MNQLFGYKIINRDRSPFPNKIEPDFHASIKHVANDSALFIGGNVSNEKKQVLRDTPELLIVVDGNLYFKKDFYAKYPIFKNKNIMDIIATLYVEYGIKSINDLTGDFILIIDDKKRDRYFIVRDKMGGRKLYYTFADGNIAFSSTIKNLLNIQGLSRDINFSALECFLKYGYVIAPATIFKSIKELEPGQLIEVSNGNHKITPYWHLHVGNEIKNNRVQIREMLYEAIRENIAIRIIPEAKIGIYLSGGIDSNTMLAFLAKQCNPSDISTISIGYGEEYKDYHELNLARSSANYFGSNHHELLNGPEHIDQYLCKAAWEFEQPFGNPALISFIALSELANNLADIIFVGIGADEVLGGYRRYNALKFLKTYYKIPFSSQINTIANGALKSLSVGANHYNPFYRLHKFFDGVQSDILKTNEAFLFGKYNNLRNSIFLPDILNNSDAVEPTLDIYYKINNTDNDFKKIFIADCYTDLVSEQLTRALIPLSKYDIDYRSPFSDPDFLQMCLNIPDKHKFNFFKTKIAYREAVSQLLPPFILKQKKRGMSHPVGLWLQGPLAGMLKQILSSNNGALNQYFQMDRLQELAEEHFKGKRDWGNLLWKMIVFSMWHKLFIEEKSSAFPDVRLKDLYRHSS